jgi:bifunctional UDP-N-acetylglucosamine pyrophosphorylase/glucosamine-1-phosphate N-acetyltransferase
MKINIITKSIALDPLTCRRTLQELPIANIAYGERLQILLDKYLAKWQGVWAENLFPSVELLEQIAQSSGSVVIINETAEVYAELSLVAGSETNETRILVDSASVVICYPWDVLTLNERIVAQLNCNDINGIVRDGVTIDGNIHLGSGSVLLPGVYIEGNVVIGENCKIGPNCYLRGNSSIGDNCHIGQAVEIKNSLLMNNVSAGHLSYLGDSIVSPDTNFGAGTITANFRHDGRNHRSIVADELLDTGRRKLGAIIGDDVHTGIHTAIYPGRKIWPSCSTLPGDIVKRDLN